jgi:hypothetical protein
MTNLTFAEYLKNRRITDTPAGDFVKDARDDHRMAEMKSWDQLETYLITQSAIPEAVAAAKAVWKSYTDKRGASS